MHIYSKGGGMRSNSYCLPFCNGVYTEGLCWGFIVIGDDQMLSILA